MKKNNAIFTKDKYSESVLAVGKAIEKCGRNDDEVLLDWLIPKLDWLDTLFFLVNEYGAKKQKCYLSRLNNCVETMFKTKEPTSGDYAEINKAFTEMMNGEDGASTEIQAWFCEYTEIVLMYAPVVYCNDLMEFIKKENNKRGWLDKMYVDALNIFTEPSAEKTLFEIIKAEPTEGGLTKKDDSCCEDGTSFEAAPSYPIAELIKMAFRVNGDEDESLDTYEEDRKDEYEGLRKRVKHYLLRIHYFNVWKDQFSWEDVRLIAKRREEYEIHCNSIEKVAKVVQDSNSEVAARELQLFQKQYEFFREKNM